MSAPLLGLTLLVFCAAGVQSNSGGPPSSVCGSLTPGHGPQSQQGNGGYIISVPSSLTPNPSGTGFTYQPGTTYTSKQNS